MVQLYDSNLLNYVLVKYHELVTNQQSASRHENPRVICDMCAKHTRGQKKSHGAKKITRVHK